MDTVLVCLPPSSGRWGVCFGTSLEIWSTSAEPEMRVRWGSARDFECKKKHKTGRTVSVHSTPASLSFRLNMAFYLWWRHFDVDDDGSQRGLEELCWMVDGVCIQYDQLKGLGQLKDPLYLTLNLSWWQQRGKKCLMFSRDLTCRNKRHLFLAGIICF